jgi:hypothetical protein
MTSPVLPALLADRDSSDDVTPSRGRRMGKTAEAPLPDAQRARECAGGFPLPPDRAICDGA